MPLIQSTISIDSNALPQGSSSRVAPSPVLNPMTPIHKGKVDILGSFSVFKKDLNEAFAQCYSYKMKHFIILVS